MREFPAELIYFLIFIALFLYQYLKKAVTRQAERETAPEAPPPRVSYPVSFDPRSLERTEPSAWSPPPLSATDFGHRAPSRVAAPPSRPRRFSRESLFNSRQDVQKAIVIATILGPPRALEAPGSAARQEPARPAPRRSPPSG